MSENLSSSISSGMGASVQDAAPSPDRGSPIPDGYGETRVVLMPRDPQWMFAYWEITDQTVREIKAQHGEDIFRFAQPTLRMHEVPADGSNSIRHVDMSIFLDARSWYLRADRESTSWYVELGLKTADGKFILIARSNVIRLPAGKVSDVIDEKWVTLRDELDQIMKASGGGRVGLGSLELARMISQRWEMLSQVSSWRGSGGVSSFGAPQIQQEKMRGFWLVADCELVLYGATESTATVTVAGKPIVLAPDGTFSLRFALPDGKLELPVHAISGDRVEEREIKITVNRNTEKK